MESKQPISPLEIINPGNGLPGTVSPNQHVVVCPEEGGVVAEEGPARLSMGRYISPTGNALLMGNTVVLKSLWP